MYENMPRVLLIFIISDDDDDGRSDIKYVLCWGRNRQHSETQNHMREPEERVRI
jgi:hypothetical protein